jgi:membrane protein
MSQDNALGLAAQLAYYLLLALVPALVFLVALTSFFPPSLLEQILHGLQSVAPAEIDRMLRDQTASIAAGNDGGLLTLGFAMALWSSSAAVVAVTDALNRAYDIEEGRSWWKVRLQAIALTIGLALFIVLAFGLVLAGPTLATRLASSSGLGPAFEWGWKVLQWPVVFALVATALGILFYFGPDADQDWEWITPGAVLGALLWLAASLLFKLYVANFASYNETYGSLGGVIVLMLWFYLSSLAILVGAEMNAEIEHASPHGKSPGEKVAGKKKAIGARAARAFDERQHAPAARPERPDLVARPREPGFAPVRMARRVLLSLGVFVASKLTGRRTPE